MFTKKDFLASVDREAAILAHLAKQVPEGQLDYRPTPAQRSTIELMRYLSMAPLFSARFAVAGTYSGAEWDELEKKSQSITVDNFGAAMKRQAREIGKLLSKIDDAALRKRKSKTWDGMSLSLGAVLIGIVLKFLTAYRMQLFLYAKASGASHLGTSDCWAGKAMKKKKAS
jgi:hypothetical protein